jgi:ABC-2 type transport system permease protein
MSKIWIIIQREFLHRVTKKSFIVLTILMPFIIAATVFVPVWLSMVKSDVPQKVVVIDDTGKYLPQFRNNESYSFVPALKMEPEFRSDTADISAVVMITDDLIQHPEAATIYSRKEVPKSLSRLVNEVLNEQIRHDKLERYDIPQLEDIMSDFETSYSVRTVKWADDGTASESNSLVAMMSGMILTFLIYMFIMAYGGMVMQSVMEEKTNRIVELIISSVKPFQLMIGKIIGIGLVGILQLCIWGVMLFVILGVTGTAFGYSALQSPDMTGAMMEASAGPVSDDTTSLLAALYNMDFLKLGAFFVLNFIGGYLIYASIFAAIAASVNEQEDSQQFMLPVTLLLVFAMYAAIASADNPDGPLAVWCSMIPLTSPVVMMVRLSFDAPMWQLILSLCILYGTALGLIWTAGKIYRVGILMYGKKPSLKEMFRWILYK